MNTRPLSFALALMFCTLPLTALAQPGSASAGEVAASAPAAASAADPAAAASVPIRIKPGPRLLSPIESRGSATQPGDVRPERAVTPQISIPFGKNLPPAAAPDSTASKRNRPSARQAGIDDAVARCEAQVGEQVRAKCRDQLAREARAR